MLIPRAFSPKLGRGSVDHRERIHHQRRLLGRAAGERQMPAAGHSRSPFLEQRQNRQILFVEQMIG
jgi:hypothetical protein